MSTALTHDAARLTTLDAAGTIAVWDVETERRVRRFPASSPGSNKLAVSADGAWIADYANGRRVEVRNAAGGPPRSFSPEGTLDYAQIVLTRGGLCTVRTNPFAAPQVWDPSSGRVLAARYSEAHFDTWSEEFSPDGTLLASGGARGSVTLWAVDSLEPLHTIYEAHGGSITALAFSPDGRTLATGGGDCEVRLWDVATHRQLLVLRGHTWAVQRARFSADGLTLATCGFAQDGRNEVVIWRTEPPE